MNADTKKKKLSPHEQTRAAHPSRKGKGPGRPHSIDDPVFRAKAIKAAANLGTDRALCGELGIWPATWVGWKNLAAASQEPYKSFFEEVDASRGKAEVKLVKRITSSKDWRALAWILKTRCGYTERHEITGAGGAPLSPSVLPPVTVVVTMKPGDPPLQNIYYQPPEQGG